MRRFQVEFGLLNLTLNLSRSLHDSLFSRPYLLKISKLLLNSIDLFVEELNLLNRRIGRVFLDRFTLNLELNKSTLESIHRLWLGVNLHANATRCFVDEVNRLIRQLTISDIALT